MFLDAVVAIAITLLVLPLIDLLGNGSQPRDLGSLISEHQAQFGSFLLSFVVIASAWLSHHRLFEQVIADFHTQRLSIGIYIGKIALNSASVTALTLMVKRRPALRRQADVVTNRMPCRRSFLPVWSFSLWSLASPSLP